MCIFYFTSICTHDDDDDDGDGNRCGGLIFPDHNICMPNQHVGLLILLYTTCSVFHGSLWFFFFKIIFIYYVVLHDHRLTHIFML